MDVALRIKINSVVVELFSDQIDTDMKKIIDKFLDEHKALMMENAPFDHKIRFNLPDLVERTHIFNEK